MTDWVVAAEELRAELLAPDANDVDRSGVIPASHFDALRNGGFYGLAFKSQDPIRTLADTGEVLVSGCLSTAFVWAQHHGTLLRLATCRNESLKAKYLTALQAGKVRAGVSGSGYASPRKALVKAARVATGYSIAGTAPFVTGWDGLTEVIGVSAYDEAAREQVTFLAQAEDVAGLVSERLELTAAHASHTVRLNFEGASRTRSDGDECDACVSKRRLRTERHGSSGDPTQWLPRPWYSESVPIGVGRDGPGL